MVKYKKRIFYELERYPRKCKECPAFSKREFRCHNEVGYEGVCEFGFFKNADMRDFTGNTLSELCKIDKLDNVKISKKGGEGL